MTKRLRISPAFAFGVAIIGILALVALVVPWLPIPAPDVQNLSLEYAPPGQGHWLGLGENGVDVLSQLLWASRLSLSISLGSVLIAAFVGLVVGSIAGYFRGPIDEFLMRIVDIVYAFPGLLLVVALAAFLGPSVGNLILAMTLTSWAGYARLARAVSMSLREQEYVVSARAIGASPTRILVGHLWPNLAAPLLVQMSYGLGAAVLVESSLSFLGLGVPIGTPSWGQMLNQGREVMMSASHLVLAPGVALVLTVLAFNLLGDGLRDWLDPKTKSR